MNWITFFAGVAVTLLVELFLLFAVMIRESMPWRK